MKLLFVIVAGICGTGCFAGLVSISKRNAPGDIDLLAPPPEQTDLETPEQLRDPGTQIVQLAVRGVVSGAPYTDGSGTRWKHANGAEVGVSYGVDVEPSMLQAPSGDSALVLAAPDRILARQSIGLNFGWLPVITDQRSRLYAELEVDRRPFGLAFGYVWEPTGVGRGVQVTGNLAFIFARATFFNDRATEILFGVDVAGATTGWMWSR
jgi:hypothetical protein